jgi:hypothetical protein
VRCCLCSNSITVDEVEVVRTAMIVGMNKNRAIFKSVSST